MLILYVFFFGYWLYHNWKRFGFNLSSFFISLYFLSAISSVVLLYNYSVYDSGRISVFAVLTHISCLFLFMSPIVYLGNRGISRFDLPSSNSLLVLMYGIIVLCFITIFTSIENIKNVFSFSNLADARKMYNEREIDVVGSGLFGYLAGIGTHLAFYAMFFAFYLISFFPKKKLLITLLFIASFSNVFYNLGAMGRDGLVRWLLFLIVNYLLFKPYFSDHFKRKLVRLSLIPVGMILFIFFVITNSRFGDREQDVMFFLLEYIGQQNIYFSYGFEQFFDGAAGGHLNFGYFLGNQISMNNLNQSFYADYHLNTFATFIGSFYLDMGFLSPVILSLSFFLVSYIFIKSGKLNFFKLAAFLIFLEIEVLGVFYYMFYAPTRINTLILLLLVSLIIYLINRSSRIRPQHFKF